MAIRTRTRTSKQLALFAKQMSRLHEDFLCELTFRTVNGPVVASVKQSHILALAANVGARHVYEENRKKKAGSK
jgi:hypothetical protein